MTADRGGRMAYWRWGIAAAALFGAVWLIESVGREGASLWGAPTVGSSIWPGGGKLFLSSVGFAALAAAMAVVLAFPVGIHLGRGAGRTAILALVPVVIPPHVAAYVWRFVLDDMGRLLVPGAAAWRSPVWGFFGGAWTLAALYWPLIAFPVALGMRLHGNRLAQELATLAPRRAVFWRAVVPGLAPALVAGAGVFFLLALSNYSVPLMWNVPSQDVAVFSRLAAHYSPMEALALSAPLQGVAVLLCCGGLIWMRRRPYAVDIGQALLPPAPSAGNRRLAAPLLAGVVMLVTAGAPIAALLVWRNPVRILRADWVAGGLPYVWGLTLAAIGAAGATAIGMALAEVARGIGRAFSAVVEVMGLLALFAPAAILCLILAGALGGAGGLGVIYDSPAIFFVGYGLRFFYIPWKVARMVQRFEGPEHGDLVRVIGLGPVARAWLRMSGVLRLGLCVSWLVVFALALGELEIATFLAQPGREPISVFLDNLMHHGRSAAVVEWSLIVVLTEAAIAAVVLWVGLSQWRKLSVPA